MRFRINISVEFMQNQVRNLLCSLLMILVIDPSEYDLLRFVILEAPGEPVEFDLRGVEPIFIL